MELCKFTEALQDKHPENVLIIHNMILARPYAQNWQVHVKPTQPYVGRGMRQ